MKNKFIRLTCLLLVLLTVLPLAAACSDKEEKPGQSNGGNGDVGGSEDIFADLRQNDDTEIVISLSKFTSSQITMESYQYIQGPDSMTSDEVQNMVYDRNADVINGINVEPRYVYTTLNWDGIMADIQQKVLAGGKNSPDLYVDQAYGMIRAQQAGFLKNVLEEGSKIDLESEGWYTDYMNAFNFASKEKSYLLAGDYFMDVIRFMNTIGCNLTMFNNLFTKQGGTNLLYDTVEDGKWTYDQMMTWCEAAFVDNGTNKGRADKEDQLGLIADNDGPYVMGWVPSSNVTLFDIQKDGSFKVFKNNDERAINVIDKLMALMDGTQGVLFGMTADIDNAAAREIFIDGKALFTSGVLLSSLETTQYQQMEDDKCVIPYPKLTEDDRYYVTSHDNARVGGILINTAKFEATTAWCQAMSRTSTAVLDKYYNEALKFRYGTDRGTTKMLDIIYESICAPNWITASAICSTNNIDTSGASAPLAFWYSGTSVPKTNTYISNYASIRSQLDRALIDFNAAFEKLD